MLRKILVIATLLLCSLGLTGCGGSSESERAEGEYQKVKLIMTVNGTNIATDTKTALKFAELKHLMVTLSLMYSQMTS